MELEGKRILVTGAGRGIGRAIALAMAGHGALVGLLGRSKASLMEVVEQIGGTDPPWIGLADIGSPFSVEAALKDLLKEWGGVDVLINNAGVQGPIGMTHTIEPSAWAETVQVNLVGTFLCSRMVLPGMISRREGKIVNLSGGGAVSPRPRFSAYSASKAGVERFTETLAAEVAEYGIEVNAMAPGPLDTGMLQEILAAGDAAGPELEIVRSQRCKDFQDFERPVALAVYLASARSDGLSGRLLSAVWDDWEHLDVAEVMTGERFTVRRLTEAH